MRNGRHPAVRLMRNGSALVGFVVLLVVVGGALLAGLIAPRPPAEIDLESALTPPSMEHPFGTDAFGRDVLSRVLHGARISLGVGFMARTISLLLGLALGTVAGFFGGKLDGLIMRIADITFAFPALLLLIHPSQPVAFLNSSRQFWGHAIYA